MDANEFFRSKLVSDIDRGMCDVIDMVDGKVTEIRKKEIQMPDMTKMESAVEFAKEVLAQPMTPLAVSFITGGIGGMVGAAVAGPVGVGLVLGGMGIGMVNDLTSLASLHFRLKKMCPETYEALNKDFAEKNSRPKS